MVIEIVDLPNKKDDFPVRYVSLPEGNIYHVFLAMRAKIDQVRGMIGPWLGWAEIDCQQYLDCLFHGKSQSKMDDLG